MKNTNTMMETQIAGIPCQVDVDTLLIVPPWKGSAQTAPSDLDYYGYTEIEYTVYDRKGYKAAWLENKMTQEDIERIEQEIIEDSSPDPDYYDEDEARERYG